MATKKSNPSSSNKKQPLNEMNETGRRSNQDRRQQAIPVAQERRKVKRRRQIDPTTCEREYNASEIEFMQAMDEYKRRSGRMFPTCSEILEVIRGMGYVRLETPDVEASEEVEEAGPDNEKDGVRTADVIAGSLDDVEDLDDSLDTEVGEEEFEDEFDEE